MKKTEKGEFTFLFKELERLKNSEDYSDNIKTAELTDIDAMRKAVMEVSEKHYIYCSST